MKLFRARLLAEKVATEEELQKIEKEQEADVQAAVDYAEKAPFPPLESALHDVYWEGGNK